MLNDNLIKSVSESHSLRSAWIEIALRANSAAAFDVALLTECVDRNIVLPMSLIPLAGRTPYGVRG